MKERERERGEERGERGQFSILSKQGCRDKEGKLQMLTSTFCQKKRRRGIKQERKNGEK